MKILNKNEIRELLNKIKLDEKYLEGRVITKEGNKYYLTSRNIRDIDTKDYNVRSYGYLIAELNSGRLVPKFTYLK